MLTESWFSLQEARIRLNLGREQFHVVLLYNCIGDQFRRINGLYKCVHKPKQNKNSAVPFLLPSYLLTYSLTLVTRSRVNGRRSTQHWPSITTTCKHNTETFQTLLHSSSVRTLPTSGMSWKSARKIFELSCWQADRQTRVKILPLPGCGGGIIPGSTDHDAVEMSIARW